MNTEEVDFLHKLSPLEDAFYKLGDEYVELFLSDKFTVQKAAELKRKIDENSRAISALDANELENLRNDLKKECRLAFESWVKKTDPSDV